MPVPICTFVRSGKLLKPCISSSFSIIVNSQNECYFSRPISRRAWRAASCSAAFLL
ncbi:hypothetical protein EVA_09621 [gut metagenome]|uniref:Uncharacterized protein n=1 Tax=gut metagenome TaxID=749906 RepID=J9GQE5_9ZZZZ